MCSFLWKTLIYSLTSSLQSDTQPWCNSLVRLILSFCLCSSHSPSTCDKVTLWWQIFTVNLIVLIITQVMGIHIVMCVCRYFQGWLRSKDTPECGSQRPTEQKGRGTHESPFLPPQPPWAVMVYPMVPCSLWWTEFSFWLSLCWDCICVQMDSSFKFHIGIPLVTILLLWAHCPLPLRERRDHWNSNTRTNQI